MLSLAVSDRVLPLELRALSSSESPESSGGVRKLSLLLLSPRGLFLELMSSSVAGAGRFFLALARNWTELFPL